MSDAATATRSTTTKIEFRRPWLYEKQTEAIYDPRRLSLIEATTKCGKTLGCIIWIVEQALFGGGEGRNYWWVAPVSTQAEIAFTQLDALQAAQTSEKARQVAQDALQKGISICGEKFTINRNGSKIECVAKPEPPKK